MAIPILVSKDVRMLKTYQDLLKNEAVILAPYAMKSAESAGRVHGDREDFTRLPFQRDRDRVIHSKAFRRLQAKTQVFVSYYGDHYRDRMTHSIEVSQISRDIARSLGLNEDLAETIALAHDLGHPPFGHGGQDALDEAMREFGSHFEHNEQSRRIVEKLEKIYPDFDGLNLTKETLDGLLKHDSSHHLALLEYKTAVHLESQVVDFSDEIAYSSHDVDDGLRSGVLKVEDMRKFVSWVAAEEQVLADYGHDNDVDRLRSRCVSRLITNMIRDLTETTEKNLVMHNIQSVADVRQFNGRLVGFSQGLRNELTQFRIFLMEHFYLHPQVNETIQAGKTLLKKLFFYYVEHPQELPEMYQKNIEGGEKKEVVIKDYIAGMTDHYAEEQANKIAI